MAWRTRQLTDGSAADRFHAHSYYDIPVWNEAADKVAGFRTGFAERMPTPDDVVEIGVVHTSDGAWEPVGESHAWSWQQGPMVQFVPNTGGLIWNRRTGPDGFGSSLRAADGTERQLDLPVYALSPDGRVALSLNMARLEALRPGYGYAVASRPTLDRLPDDDGLWRLSLAGDTKASLVLSLREARRVLFAWLPLRERLRHRGRRYAYWFNHAKISPDGARYTVKLRWRVPGQGWSDKQGVSLTGSLSGGDVRVLTDRSSHVIWEDRDTLFLWRGEAVERYRDEAPSCRYLGPIAPDSLRENVHIRARPGHAGQFFYDTPYREDVALKLLDETSGETEEIARFTGHKPARGPYRCDLHPVPAPDGDRVLVTSLQDGGRQIYLVERS